jgi:hypothetical protein
VRFAGLCLFAASIALSASAQGKTRKAAPKQHAEPAFSGKFFGYEGQTLHTWEFGADGTFIHTAITKDSTAAKSTERGTFIQSGDSLALTVSTEAGATNAPPTDRSDGLVMGGGPETKGGKKRSVQLTCKLLGAHGVDGLVLDGVTLKPKTW